MSTKGMITITDSEGWRKVFPLQSQLIHVGSDRANDIVLDPGRGSGVAPRHLQLLALPTGIFRAVNLSDSDIMMGESGDRIFAPRSVQDVGHGESIRLGQFLLVFGLEGDVVTSQPLAPVSQAPIRPAPSGTVAAARGPGRTLSAEQIGQAIGLRLFLPEAVLAPDKPLEGQVSVHNLGREPGVQFRLEVEGLDSDCCEIGPGPILFPNVQKSVFLRLQHPRRPSPPPGPLEIRVRASAPEHYPGGSVTVAQKIEILPYVAHSMTLVPED